MSRSALTASRAASPLRSNLTPSDREQRELRHLFVTLVAILVGFGIQMVHSASLTTMPGRTDAPFLQRHLLAVAVAAAAGCVAAAVSPRMLRATARPLLVLLILLLVAVLIPDIGARVNGASRWLRLGSLSLQPSEFGRIILPIVGSTTMWRLRRQHRCSWRSLPTVLAPLSIVIPLVLAEPDLGASVFLATGYLLPFVLGGWPWQHFLCGGLLLVPLCGGLFVLRPYQLERITGFLSSWRDLNSAPWQIRQSLLSLGSGGLHGKGIGEGWQKLSYLPEANTDFVFSVIGEELGLVGTLTICLLWIGVFLTGRASLAHLPQVSFARILGSTLHLQLVLQAMANIAVVTAMVPPKGVPQPFISYGGTNLLVSLMGVGLIVAMAKQGEANGGRG